jgi:glycosyltransferase involved in cell wall biosynthesis
VLSSDYEGLPGVLIRALAANVPVVTTDSFFAARELLDDVQSCAVVPTGDVDAFAKAIDHCLAVQTAEDLGVIVEPYQVAGATESYIATFNRLVETA